MSGHSSRVGSLSWNSFILSRYFILLHQKNTRNNAKTINLPKVKTEYGRKFFHFNGGKLSNMLPWEGHSLNKLDFSNF